ncbi:unnamed protein product [Paramecium primaurelia]|uniref:Uncharacterized protein n=1 Tax=Paramecium primaurelia TaxID=5886 RepID=A0A8S1NWN4_PARPR|nr:unnamed protein product [Paramecium primaurelia]
MSVSFSPDGNTLASGSQDSSICLWDVKTKEQDQKLEGHISIVYQISFSSDRNTLAFVSQDNSICLWDIKTGQQKAKLDGHTSTVLSVCFSPDGKTLASGSWDNSILLWDVQNGKAISSSDKIYKDILAQFKAPLCQNNPSPESNNAPILRISQIPLFQAQGALILKGDFITHEGYDLKQLFKSKRSCFLEDFNQK